MPPDEVMRKSVEIRAFMFASMQIQLEEECNERKEE